MNSNLFSNAMLTMQEPFMNSQDQGDAFSSWDAPAQNTMSNGFQNDGSQMQSFMPGLGSNGFSGQSMPPGLFAAIAQAISQYFNGASQQSPAGNTEGFQQVHLGSVGDPHNSVSGTTLNGNSVNSHWDNMQSHQDLLTAPSLAGGLRLSSQTGPANGNGATMNQSVTAYANHGQTAISFNADGNATITQGNTINSMVPNETMQLGNGLSVTDQGNSLVLRARNLNGGSLTTTLAQNGQGGVDVNAQGQNVRLGGYMINSLSKA